MIVGYVAVIAVMAAVVVGTVIEIDIFDLIVVEDKGPLYSVLKPVFSSKRLEFVRSITSNSGGGKSPNASLDTQHLYPGLHNVCITKNSITVVCNSLRHANS